MLNNYAWVAVALTGIKIGTNTKAAVLSQGVPRDAAVNFCMYRSFQWHRMVFTAIAMLSN